MIISIVTFPMKKFNGGPPEFILDLAPSFFGKANPTYICVDDVDREFKDLELFGKVLIQPILSKKFQGIFFKWTPSIEELLESSDVILIHGYYLLSTLKILLNRQITSKIFILANGVFEPYHQKQSRVKKYCFDLIVRKLAKSKITCFLAANSSEMFNIRKKFPETSVSVVGLGLNFLTLPTVSSQKQYPTDGVIKLIHIGRITEKKRIDLIIHVVKILIDRGISVVLNIVGDGEKNLIIRLQLLSLKLNIQEFVLFQGYVSRERKWKLLEDASVFLLPSESENYATSVAEANYFGVPVIVSSNVGMSVHVIKYSTGIVINDLSPVSYADAVMQIMEGYYSYAQNTFLTRDTLSNKRTVENFLKIMISDDANGDN
jgi:glycosyltransferase involved in cell wall biosynthesis